MTTLTVQAKHSIAAKKFRLLAAALAKAGPEVLKEGNAEVQALIQRVASDKLGPHKKTGHAESVVKAYPDARGIALDMPKYLRYQGENRKDREVRKEREKSAPAPEKRNAFAVLILGKAKPVKKEKGKANWWPFARGIPLAIKVKAAKIYAEKLRKIIEGA